MNSEKSVERKLVHVTWVSHDEHTAITWSVHTYLPYLVDVFIWKFSFEVDEKPAETKVQVVRFFLLCKKQLERIIISACMHVLNSR